MARKTVKTQPPTSTRVTRSASRSSSAASSYADLPSIKHESEQQPTPPSSQDNAPQEQPASQRFTRPKRGKKAASSLPNEEASSTVTDEIAVKKEEDPDVKLELAIKEEEETAQLVTPPMSQVTTPQDEAPPAITTQRATRTSKRVVSKKAAAAIPSPVETVKQEEDLAEAASPAQPSKGKSKGKGKAKATAQAAPKQATSTKRTASKRKAPDNEDGDTPTKAAKKTKQAPKARRSKLPKKEEEEVMDNTSVLMEKSQESITRDDENIDAAQPKRRRGKNKKTAQGNLQGAGEGEPATGGGGSEVEEDEIRGQGAPAKTRRPQTKTKDPVVDDRDLPAELVLNMPEEMWMQVFSHLYPSEMVKFAQCSKAIYKLVQEQPHWGQICKTAELAQPKRKFNNYYQVALYHSDVVCEQCYSLASPKSSRPSNRPLKLKLEWNKHGHPVRLCPACRYDYLEDHPKADSKDPTTFEYGQTHLTKGRVLLGYHLPESIVNTLPHQTRRNPHYRSAPPMRLYDIDTVREHVRRYHGGFMGLLEYNKPYVPPRCKRKPSSNGGLDGNAAAAAATSTTDNSNDGEGSSQDATTSQQQQQQSVTAKAAKPKKQPRAPKPKKNYVRYYASYDDYYDPWDYSSYY